MVGELPLFDAENSRNHGLERVQPAPARTGDRQKSESHVRSRGWGGTGGAGGPLTGTRMGTGGRWRSGSRFIVFGPWFGDGPGSSCGLGRGRGMVIRSLFVVVVPAGGGGGGFAQIS